MFIKQNPGQIVGRRFVPSTDGLTRVMILIAIVLFSCVKQPAHCADEVIDGDKVLVLMLFDDHCHKWCGEVRPILQEIKQEYGDRIAFHELNVTRNVLKEAEANARKLGVGNFIAGAADWVPMVGIFTIKRHLVKELPGKNSKSSYVSAIEKALKKQ